MSDGSAKIDAYIAKAQPFAQPILQTLRTRVHAAIPEIEEALKWSMPAFLYKGKILCGMGAFKAHATFGLWHGELATGGTDGRAEAMGDLGRIGSVGDLPDAATMHLWFLKAKQLIDDGVKPPHTESRDKAAKAEIAMVPAFRAALDANAAAKATYDGFPPSARREYLEWVAEAKRDETRDKRIAQAVEWMAEGKRRNWKYENC